MLKAERTASVLWGTVGNLITPFEPQEYTHHFTATGYHSTQGNPLYTSIEPSVRCGHHQSGLVNGYYLHKDAGRLRLSDRRDLSILSSCHWIGHNDSTGHWQPIARAAHAQIVAETEVKGSDPL